MRVLFTAWSWPTHVNQMIPLAWALRAAGHEARIAVPPGIRDTVAASGVPTVAVGDDGDAPGAIRSVLANPPSGSGGGVPRSVAMFTALAEAMGDDLLSVGRAWAPDIVVFEPSAYAGPLVASALGVPSARHLWGSDLMGFLSAKPPVRAAEQEALAPLASRLGANEISTVGTVTIDPCPPSMQVDLPIRRLGVRYVPFHGRHAAAVPNLSETGRPRVCVTWGTTVGRVAPERSRAVDVVRALATSDVDVVFAVADEQMPDLRDLPDKVVVLRSPHLDELLGQCDAVVGHGGAGTIMTGLTRGLPQVAVPLLPDHRFNSMKLAETKAGLVLPIDECDPDQVRATVARLFDEVEFQTRARELAGEIAAQPTASVVVEELARFVDGAVGPPTP